MSETRKIAAILVSDVVGYSRLGDLIDPTISVHRGRIVKRTGDGSVIEFRSVVDAVRCAIEVQHAMVERNAGVALEKRIEFRIGIHLGDVVEESDGDLMGDGVNIAARLEGICKPGAVCLSEDAYRQVKGRLDLTVIDLGPTQLKNIAEPVGVYSLEIGVPALAKPSEPKRRLSPALIAIAIAALAVLAAASAWYFLNANRPASVATKAPAEAARLSIVVLPFANLSGDPGQDYLVDALTDALTTALARIRGNFVIARNTAMTFKGKPVDAKAIGRDLGVRYVLEGSVQPSGDRMRVNAQCRRRTRLSRIWRTQSTFNSPRWRPPVSNGHPRPIPMPRTFWVPAALGLSGDPKGDLERADELESKALALDPDFAWAHGTKGWILQNQRRTEESVPEFERALALDPSGADAYNGLGVDYLALGRFDQSLEVLNKAIRASPSDPSLTYYYGNKAWANFGLKRYDAAIEPARRAIAINPYNPYANVALVAALALTDHDAEAREALQRYLGPSTASFKTIAAWKAHLMSLAPKQGGDPRFLEMSERSYDGLRRAGMPEE